MATTRPPVTRLQDSSSRRSSALLSASLAKRHLRAVLCPSTCTYHRPTPAPAGETGAWLCSVKAVRGRADERADVEQPPRTRAGTPLAGEIASTVKCRQLSRITTHIISESGRALTTASSYRENQR